MSKYSRIYQVGKRRFRYNYEDAMLEWVSNVTKKVLAENEEWRKEFGDGEDLWDIVDGKVVHDRIGLFRENWKESPEYWCQTYSDELDESFYWEQLWFEKEMGLGE